VEELETLLDEERQRRQFIAEKLRDSDLSNTSLTERLGAAEKRESETSERLREQVSVLDRSH
jgi:hypothetical protein